MRRSYMCALLMLAPLAGRADPAAVWVQRGAAAEAAFDPAAALRDYLAAEAAAPGQASVLQKIARQYSDLADDQPTLAGKLDYARQALRYSERAVQAEPRNAVNVLSLAISHAKLAMWSDLREKVAYSRLVKTEAEQAIALDPNYAWAHHVLGCWNYEVAELSGTARLWLRLFYGGLPTASAAAAIRELQRAVALEPGELAHRIELGFAYQAAGDPAAARQQFEAGLAMPCRERFDREAQARARLALAQLAGAATKAS